MPLVIQRVKYYFLFSLYILSLNHRTYYFAFVISVSFYLQRTIISDCYPNIIIIIILISIVPARSKAIR